MIAAMPMYDHPGVRTETDALWSAISARLEMAGIDTPAEMERDRDIHEQWHDPRLLLGQACGLPFRTELRGRVALIGALDYGLPDTPPGYYHSVFMARRDDPRNALEEFGNAVLACNDHRSHSGWAVACEAMVRFRPGPFTGSHRGSCEAVAAGAAEIAAIDAQSLRLIETHTSLADGLKPVGRSAATPGQALITAFPEHLDALRAAVEAGVADLSAQQRDALGIRGFVRIDEERYYSVPIPPSPEAYFACVA